MEFWIALSLTLLAGVATGLGGLFLLAPFAKGEKFMNFSLAFSGGVMLLISFVEIFPKSIDHLSTQFESFRLMALGSLFFGMVIFYGVNFFFKDKDQIERVSMLIPLVIMMHNIPEGLLTFLSGLQDPQFGFKVAIAVSLHNIPEGLAIAFPIYLATKDSKKAILWAFFSGIMEAVGALLGYLILKPYLSDTLYGLIFACIAGIMIVVSLVELIPMSFNKEPKIAQLGLLFGFLFMGASLAIMF